MINKIIAEIDRFRDTLIRARNMNETIELFKAGHHSYSVTVGGMLTQVANALTGNPAVPDRVKGSIIAYVDHFNHCRNLEHGVMSLGGYTERVECVQAFLTDLAIFREALVNRMEVTS